MLRNYIPFESIYLFGFYAKDSYNAANDIDVAIVVDHIEGEYISIIPLQWKIIRQIDNRIEPILIERENDDRGFLNEIKKLT